MARRMKLEERLDQSQARDDRSYESEEVKPKSKSQAKLRLTEKTQDDDPKDDSSPKNWKKQRRVPRRDITPDMLFHYATNAWDYYEWKACRVDIAQRTFVETGGKRVVSLEDCASGLQFNYDHDCPKPRIMSLRDTNTRFR